MGMVLGYSPSQTDLPGSIAKGLALGGLAQDRRIEKEKQKSIQGAAVQKQLLALDAAERAEKQYNLDVSKFKQQTDLDERREKRLSLGDEHTRVTKFNEDIRQYEQSALQKGLSLELAQDNLQAKLLGLAGESGAARQSITEMYERNQVKFNKIPGGKEASKFEVMSLFDENERRLMESVGVLYSNSNKQTFGLQSAIMQDMEKAAIADKQVQQIEKDKNTRANIEIVTSAARRFDGDPSGWAKQVDAWKNSPTPLLQELGQFAEATGVTSITPSGIERDLVNAMEPEEQKRYVMMQKNRAGFNFDTMTEADINTMGTDIMIKIEASDEMPKDTFWYTALREQYPNEPYLELNSANLVRLLKDTMIYSKDMGEQFVILQGLIETGQMPKRNKAGVLEKRKEVELVGPHSAATVKTSAKSTAEEKKETKPEAINVRKALYDDYQAAMAAVKSGKNPIGVQNKLLEKYTDPNDIEVINSINWKDM